MVRLLHRRGAHYDAGSTVPEGLVRHVLQMPHYHAEEATRCIKPILGDYYTFDGREVFLTTQAPSHSLTCDMSPV